MNWYKGMVVRRSDTVVSNGKLYRVNMPPDGKTYVSLTPPTHDKGNAEYDGITWAMSQERVVYNCRCRNIHFKNIYLQKKRPIAFSIHFDRDNWSRSYYPNSEAPVQENLTFENIIVENNNIPILLQSVTPVDNIRVINCSLKNNKVHFLNVKETGIKYPNTKMLFCGTEFKEEIDSLVNCENGTSATVSICATLNDSFKTSVTGSVLVKESDLTINQQ